MINLTILLAVEEVAEKGGLFDINATLPLMAIQFLLLAFVLDKIFYKPLGKAIDSRADYIRDNQLKAEERLAKAKHNALICFHWHCFRYSDASFTTQQAGTHHARVG